MFQVLVWVSRNQDEGFRFQVLAWVSRNQDEVSGFSFGAGSAGTKVSGFRFQVWSGSAPHSTPLQPRQSAYSVAYRKRLSVDQGGS